MVQGSCGCGELKYEFTGEPGGFAVCHCIACKKSSGTPGSYNLFVPADNFKVTSGSSKTWTRTGDSGKTVTNHTCPTCSSLLWVEADALTGTKLVKAGLLDDAAYLEKLGKPKSEIYCKHMSSWEDKIPGADYKQEMMS